MGVAAQRVGVAAAEREQAEAVVAHRRAERCDLRRREAARRNVVEHDRVVRCVPRRDHRQRLRPRDHGAHSACCEDARDRRVGSRGDHERARGRADIDACRQQVVLRALIAHELDPHAERVPAEPGRRVRQGVRVVAALQLDDLARGTSAVVTDREPRGGDRRRADGREQRDRVALVHDLRRTEARQRSVAHQGVVERDGVDRHVPRACRGGGTARISGRLQPVAERDDAPAPRCRRDRGLETALEIGRPGAGWQQRLHGELARVRRNGLGAGGEGDDTTGLDAAPRRDRSEPARLHLAHGRIDARRAVEREHRARAARSDVRVHDRESGRERREHGDAGER